MKYNVEYCIYYTSFELDYGMSISYTVQKARQKICLRFPMRWGAQAFCGNNLSNYAQRELSAYGPFPHLDRSTM